MRSLFTEIIGYNEEVKVYKETNCYILILCVVVYGEKISFQMTTSTCLDHLLH